MNCARPAAILLGALTLALAGCSDAETAAPADTAAGTAAASSTSAPAPSGPTTSGSGPASTAPTQGPRPSMTSSPGSGDVTRTLPAVPQTTRPPVTGSAPAEFGGGLQVRLVGSRAVTIAGKGPGETSGPGMAYTLSFRNGSKDPVDGSLVVVSATDRAGTPLSDTSSAPTARLSGRLAPGQSGTGTYAFLLDGTARGDVVLTVNYAPLATSVTIVPEPSR